MKPADLIAKVGEAKALLIMQDQIKPEWLESLSTEDLVKLYKHLPQSSNFSHDIRSLIENRKSSLLEWVNIYESVSMTLSLKETAYNEAIAKAKTFTDWLLIYQKTRISSDLQDIAWEKVIALAETFSQWWQIKEARNLKDYRARQEVIIQNLSQKAVTSEDWQKLLYWEEVPGEVKEKAFLRTIEAMPTVAEIADIYNDILNSRWSLHVDVKAYYDQVVQAMKNQAKTFEDWVTIYCFISYSLAEYQKLIENMLPLAQTFLQWLWLYKRSEPSEAKYPEILFKLQELTVTFEQKIAFRAALQWNKARSKREAIAEISRFEASFEQWQSVYRQYPKTKYLKEIALDKMLTLAQTFNQWLELWLVISDKDPRKDKVLEKLQQLVVIEAE